MKSFSKKSNNGLPVDTVAEGFDWPLCTAAFDQIYQRDLLAHSQSATLQWPSIPTNVGNLLGVLRRESSRRCGGLLIEPQPLSNGVCNFETLQKLTRSYASRRRLGTENIFKQTVLSWPPDSSIAAQCAALSIFLCLVLNHRVGKV